MTVSLEPRLNGHAGERRAKMPAYSPRGGYAHPNYAYSFDEFGQIRTLPRSGGFLLQRPIPGTDWHDAAGCYPLFSCRHWHHIGHDLKALSDELVAVGLVADPFGDYTPELLQKQFPDVCYPFKSHFLIDLHRAPDESVSAHHRRYARKALRTVSVEFSVTPWSWRLEWLDLYNHLIQRHGITGLRAFSPLALSRQFFVPGLVAVRGRVNGRTVGMTLWYVQGQVGYYHLGAYSPRGYELRASFALFWRTIEYFADHGLRWLNLGAGAGLSPTANDGLTRFKRGWSSDTRPVYFCGRILHPDRYRAILAQKQIVENGFFPAYRYGEYK